MVGGKADEMADLLVVLKVALKEHYWVAVTEKKKVGLMVVESVILWVG